MSTDEPTLEIRPQKLIRLRYVIPAVLAIPVIVLIVFGAVVAGAKPSIRLSQEGLATVTTPYGGGTVARVSAIGGREQKDIPVTLRGHTIWPQGKIPQGERVTVVATIKRPSWISWVAGDTERVSITEVTPVAHLRSTYVTRANGQPLTVRFREPVQVVGSGALGREFDPHQISTPSSVVRLHTSPAAAGTIAVAAAVRSWEQPTTTTVSWFPRGKRASVVATPDTGTRITPTTTLTLTFSRPVDPPG